MTPVELILLVGLGTWAAMDGAALGQFMVSRPFVSGTLAGAVLGDPLMGAMVGGVMELLFLGNLAVGGVVLPEPGPAAVPAVALAATLSASGAGAAGAVGVGGLSGTGGLSGIAAEIGGAPVPGAVSGSLVLGVALGILLALVGGSSIRLQRSLNDRLANRAWSRGGTPAALSEAQAGALALEAGRGVLLTGGGLGVVWVLMEAGVAAQWASLWPLALPATLGLLVVTGMLGLGRMVAVAAAVGGGRPGGGGPVVRRPLMVLGVGLVIGVALAAGVGLEGPFGSGNGGSWTVGSWTEGSWTGVSWTGAHGGVDGSP